jgi:hypothetical protein
VWRTETLTGQTSWSKALVRHGSDARVALAGVLGVSAGDIWVRDRGDREARVARHLAEC